MTQSLLDHDNVKIMDSKLEDLVSPVSKVICYLVILLSLLFIASLSVAGLIIGLILLGTSLAFITAKKRITVDFENSQYKEYIQMFGIKSGEWEKLVDCKIITITPSTKVFSNNVAMGGAQTYSTSSSVNLNLKKDNYKKITIAYGSYKEILQKAHFASIALENIEIMDYTVQPARKISS